MRYLLPTTALYALVALQPVLQRRAVYVGLQPGLDARHCTRGVGGPIAAQARRMSIVYPMISRSHTHTHTLSLSLSLYIYVYVY